VTYGFARVDALKGSGPFTAVRATTNASFDSLPDRIITMQRKPEHLTRALTYHDRMLMSRRSAVSGP